MSTTSAYPDIGMAVNAVLLDPAQRRAAYRRVRRSFRGVSALCAATASDLLIRAGVLSGYRAWTADLAPALDRKGWARFTTRGNLRCGDLCYSTDLNGNGAPDHVWFFIRWLDEARAVAEVVDNYRADPHPRNLGAPCWHRPPGGLPQRLARTPFAFAQRPPEGS